MSRWRTPAEPDLRGLRAIVTGANSGLGRLTAQSLVRSGVDVTLAVRRVDAGEQAAQRIRDDGGAGVVRVARLDLGNLDSVAEFAAGQEVAAGQGEQPVDLLVNNAGQMLIPERRTTDDGFERHMGVNHLGHFALTARLWPALAPTARIVSLSSIAHRAVRRIDVNLSTTGDYTPMGAYGQSKLAVLLFTAELDRRLRAAASGRTAVAAHPGWSATAEHQPDDHPPFGVRISRQATAVLGSKAVNGARSQIHAAVGTDVRGGEFWGPRLLVGGRPHLAQPSAGARDAVDAAWLWAESERLTGVRFPVREAL